LRACVVVVVAAKARSVAPRTRMVCGVEDLERPICVEHDLVGS
jgi:hypothetical protein